jgi:hypothetical protein
MLRFLARSWAGLSEANQATWRDRASLTNISPCNAFLGENQRRWREFLAPTQIDPATETGTDPVLTLDSATGGTRSATLTFTLTTANDLWGIAIFRATGETITPSVANCIYILPAPSPGTFTWVDSDLDAGTYTYNAKALLIAGKAGAAETARTATVT